MHASPAGARHTIAQVSYSAASPHPTATMPIALSASDPTLLIRRVAFERAGLTRAQFDERLNLTADEFRIEGGLIAIGPLHDADAIGPLVAELETLGLRWFDDIFELSGNWPDWLTLFAMVADR